MDKTPDEQVEAMREFCKQLNPAEVHAAYVDDWGRYGNFSIIVTPVEHTRHSTNKLKALVRKNLPAGAHLRGCIPPVALNQKAVPAKKGYTRSYWMFDIDFQYYDPGSNTFASN